MKKKKALLMVDIQNDFCKGGALAVPKADEIISKVNQLQAYFDQVIATQDWHPINHISFAVNHPGTAVGDIIAVKDADSQVLWPVHCVQESEGAKLHPLLDKHLIARIFYKGIDPAIDSYSAFFDNAHQRSTQLGEYLQAEVIEEIYIVGLATDYCVMYSALDAVRLGFKVYVIEDACKGVELKSGDTAKALRTMQAEGIKLVDSSYIFLSNE